MDKNSLEYKKQMLAKFKKLKGYDDGGPVGMGDVQRADEFASQYGRQLPTLEQGYGNQQADTIANALSGSNLIQNPNKPSPSEVSNTQNTLNMATGATGGIKLWEDIPGYASELSDGLKKLYSLDQGSPAYNDLSNKMMENLSLRSENNVPHVLVKDPNNPNKILKMSTEDGTLENINDPKEYFRAKQIVNKMDIDNSKWPQQFSQSIDTPEIYKEHINKLAPNINDELISGQPVNTDEFLMAAKELANKNTAMQLPFSSEAKQAIQSGNANFPYNTTDIDDLKNMAKSGNKVAANFLKQLNIINYADGGNVMPSTPPSMPPPGTAPQDSIGNYFDSSQDDPVADLVNGYFKVKGYADGGGVRGPLTWISDQINAVTGGPGPVPAPSPVPSSLDQKYQKIRDDIEADRNQSASDDSDDSNYPTPNGHYKGGKIKKYTNGGHIKSNDDTVGFIESPLDTGNAANVTAGTAVMPVNTDQLNYPTQEMVNQQNEPVDRQDEEQQALNTIDDSLLGQLSPDDQSVNGSDQDTDSDDNTSNTDQSQAISQDNTQAPAVQQSPQAPTMAISRQSPLQATMAGMPSAQNSDPAMQALIAAQQQRQAALAGQSGAQAGALLAAGMAGHGATPANPAYLKNEALAQAPVQNVLEQAAYEKQDPDSAVSKFYRDYLTKRMGVDPSTLEGVSADGLEKLFPQVTRIIGADYQQKLAAQKIDAQKDIATQRTQQQKYAADLAAQTRMQVGQMMAGGQQNRYNNMIIQRMADKSLDYAPVKQAVQSKMTLANSLNSINDPNVPLTPQVLYDAQKNIAMALSGRPGGATQQQVQSMVIDPMEARIKSFEQRYLSSSPSEQADMRNTDTGKDMVNFINNFGGSINDQLDRSMKAAQQSYVQNAMSAFSGNQQISQALGNIKQGAPVNIPTGQQSQSAQGVHKPGDIVIYKGKQYQVGQDGNTLTPVGQ